MLRKTTNHKNKYEIIKRIGSGTYGKVYKAICKEDRKIVAIKIVDISKMDKAGIDSILNEIRILSSISNPYIVEYYEAFLDSSETHFWIIMEYVGGGDLANAIKISQRDKIRINEKQIWSYLIQILKGILDLHKLKIVHRDIKPANIFLTEDYKRIKIGDMNVSKILKQDLTKTQIGTPYYLAPEIWNKKSYDFKADVFSLGALIYELAALKHPYEAKSTSELHHKIKHEKIPKLPSYYSEDLNYIVYKCLTKEQIIRPTAEQLLNSKTIQKKIRELDLQKFIEETINNGCLLDTIILPKKLNQLNKKLPKGNMPRSQSAKNYKSSRSKRKVALIESSKITNNTKTSFNSRNSGSVSSKKRSGKRESSIKSKKGEAVVRRRSSKKTPTGQKSVRLSSSRKESKDSIKRKVSKELLAKRNSQQKIERRVSRELIPKKSKVLSINRRSSKERRSSNEKSQNSVKHYQIKRRKSTQEEIVRMSYDKGYVSKEKRNSSSKLSQYKTERSSKNLSMNKKRKSSPSAKMIVNGLMGTPLPISKKRISNKAPPVNPKYFSHKVNKALVSDKNNPPLKMPKTPANAFSKKYVTEKHDISQQEKKSLKNVENKKERYQSPRAMRYADYINKMANKDRQKEYKSTGNQQAKRCRSFNKHLAF